MPLSERDKKKHRERVKHIYGDNNPYKKEIERQIEASEELLKAVKAEKKLRKKHGI